MLTCHVIPILFHPSLHLSKVTDHLSWARHCVQEPWLQRCKAPPVLKNFPVRERMAAQREPCLMHTLSKCQMPSSANAYICLEKRGMGGREGSDQGTPKPCCACVAVRAGCADEGKRRSLRVKGAASWRPDSSRDRDIKGCPGRGHFRTTGAQGVTEKRLEEAGPSFVPGNLNVTLWILRSW